MKNPWLVLLQSLALMLVCVQAAFASNSFGQDLLVSDMRKNARAPGPLVLALHPENSSARKFRGASGLDRAARGSGVMIVYPQAEGAVWDFSTPGSTDFEGLMALISMMYSDPRVAQRPVLVIGHGAGGAMALRLACDVPEVVAGIGVVSAKVPQGLRCPNGAPKPAIFVHGTADPVQVHDGGPGYLSAVESVSIWTQRNRCTNKVRTRKTDRIRSDRTAVVTRKYRGCHAALDHVLVLGGGHSWPIGRASHGGSRGRASSEINAGTALINFLTPLVAR